MYLEAITELTGNMSQCGFGKLNHNKVTQMSLSKALLCLFDDNEISTQRENKCRLDRPKNKFIFSWLSILQLQLKINKLPGFCIVFGKLPNLGAEHDLGQCVQSKQSYNNKTTNSISPRMSIWADWIIPLILNPLYVTLPISPSCSKPRCCCTD